MTSVERLLSIVLVTIVSCVACGNDEASFETAANSTPRIVDFQVGLNPAFATGPGGVVLASSDKGEVRVQLLKEGANRPIGAFPVNNDASVSHLAVAAAGDRVWVAVTACVGERVEDELCPNSVVEVFNGSTDGDSKFSSVGKIEGEGTYSEQPAAVTAQSAEFIIDSLGIGERRIWTFSDGKEPVKSTLDLGRADLCTVGVDTYSLSSKPDYAQNRNADFKLSRIRDDREVMVDLGSDHGETFQRSLLCGRESVSVLSFSSGATYLTQIAEDRAVGSPEKFPPLIPMGDKRGRIYSSTANGQSGDSRSVYVARGSSIEQLETNAILQASAESSDLFALEVDKRLVIGAMTPGRLKVDFDAK